MSDDKNDDYWRGYSDAIKEMLYRLDTLSSLLRAVFVTKEDTDDADKN